jgi:hypothetical protein
MAIIQPPRTSFVNLPKTPENVGANRLYVDNGVLRLDELRNSYYTQGTGSSLNHPFVYAVYDQLVTDFPDYVSRSSIGTDSGGNTIYAYRFAAPRVLTNLTDSRVKIVIISALHGFEQGAALSTMIFFDELCRDWATKPGLSALRWSADFHVLPVGCPVAFDNFTRINGNGVDPNRNFPTNWSGGGSTDTGSIYYRGAAPLTEPETIAINTWIETNHRDAAVIIDHHNSSTLSVQGFAYWIATTNPQLRALAERTMMSGHALLKRDFSFLAQDNSGINRLTRTINGSLHQHYAARGIPTLLFETPTGLGGPTGTLRRTSVQMFRAFLGEFLNMELRRREARNPMPATIRPVVRANFAAGKYARLTSQGVEDCAFTDLFTFTRAAAADRVNNLGQTESMGANVPRFTYDAERTPLGLFMGTSEVCRHTLYNTVSALGWAIYVEFIAKVDGTARSAVVLNDNNISNRIYIGISAGGSIVFNRRVGNGTPQEAFFTAGTAVDGGRYRCVINYIAPGNAQLTVNSEEIISTFSGDPVSPSQNLTHLRIGNQQDGSSVFYTPLDSSVCDVALWDRALAMDDARRMSIEGLNDGVTFGVSGDASSTS